MADAELQSKPLLLKGLIAGWPAALKWAGKEGLKHLQKAAGSASVQVTGDGPSAASVQVTGDVPAVAAHSLTWRCRPYEPQEAFSTAT